MDIHQRSETLQTDQVKSPFIHDTVKVLIRPTTNK